MRCFTVDPTNEPARITRGIRTMQHETLGCVIDLGECPETADRMYIQLCEQDPPKVGAEGLLFNAHPVRRESNGTHIQKLVNPRRDRAGDDRVLVLVTRHDKLEAEDGGEINQVGEGDWRLVVMSRNQPLRFKAPDRSGDVFVITYPIGSSEPECRSLLDPLPQAGTVSVA